MFTKILVANRGEIACRIIKTAQRMNIQTVAVYSDADRDSVHVTLADEAVLIGPAPAAQSYLVMDKIIEACRQTGAQAVHPGYGFLSEREAFALALKDADIAFIGPNPRAIAAMGDKIESKKCAHQAGVSTVPGHLGLIESPEEAVSIAKSIGYPVMIKASAGGGGKGMRVAFSDEETREGFVRARSEAASSFGDDRIFIEKFIVNPRHIEIQVLGDKHGNIIHLGERECSIQRRNQKVIEEAPSPLLDDATREAMGAQAIALAKAVGYDSAGTVEFVAGQDRSFYFLEMNTRLQVEHPVTEMITGLDLVEEMIRIAAGEPLRYQQSDIKLNGWAIESRIYAEDPTRNFLPSIGRLVHYKPPQEGEINGITFRNDTGVEEGGEISIHYDPMIAKLVTHGPSRLAAIDAQAHALDAFVISGIRHNIPFLSSLMHHPRWRDGQLSTGFISEEYPNGFQPLQPDGRSALVMIAVSAFIDHRLRTRKSQISGQMRGTSFPFQTIRVVALNDAAYDIMIEHKDDHSIRLIMAEELKLVVSSHWKPGDLVWQGDLEGRSLNVQVRPILNGYTLLYAGAEADSRVLSPREAELMALMPVKESQASSRQVLCPMPGLVKAVMVTKGQEVKAGEALCIVEAMKMENVLRAERDGTIDSIKVNEGESLGVDDVILEFV